jgi:photosystem II stability/assembly factor-like uncharacterized protein
VNAPTVREFGGDHANLNAITTSTDERVLIAVRDAGAAQTSVDQGQTWTNLVTRTVSDLHAAEAVPGTNLLVAVGAAGTVLSGKVTEHRVAWDAPTQHCD